MVKDPVCNMEVDEKTARYKSVHMRETYYFCCPMCKEKFDENPSRFIRIRAEK